MDRFTALVTMLQFVGGEYSTIIGVGLEFVWVAGWLLLAGLAYTLRSWRHLVLAYSAPSILSLGTVLEWRQMLVSIKFLQYFEEAAAPSKKNKIQQLSAFDMFFHKNKLFFPLFT